MLSRGVEFCDSSIDAEKMESMRIRSLHPNRAMSVKDTIKLIEG